MQSFSRWLKILCCIGITVLLILGLIIILTLNKENKIEYNVLESTYQVNIDNNFTLDDVLFDKQENVDNFIFLNTNNSAVTIGADGTLLSFSKYGIYQIEIGQKNYTKNNKQITIKVLRNATIFSLNYSSVELFTNKLPNSVTFEALCDNSSIDITEVNFEYDNNFVNIQNGCLTPLIVGTKTVKASIETMTGLKTYMVNIQCTEWNFATNIGFNNPTITLKNNNTTYTLNPNIEYLNSNVEREIAEFSILSGADNCSLSMGVLTPTKTGTSTVQARILRATNTYIYCQATIVIEPKLEYTASILDTNKSSTNECKSGQKANSAYEEYYLAITSNLDLTNFDINIVPNVNDAIFTTTTAPNFVDKYKCSIPVYFKGSGEIQIHLETLDIALNENETVFSNTISINLTPFITKIILTPEQQLDIDETPYAPELVNADGSDTYIIYNAQGENLEQAILDKKPFSITFTANTDVEYKLQGDPCVTKTSNTFTRLVSGKQKIVVSALDGSLQTKTFYIQICDIEIKTATLTLVDTMLFVSGGKSTLDCTPQYTPNYATNPPQMQIDISDNNINKPCISVVGNIITALSATELDIQLEITNTSLSLSKSIKIQVFNNPPTLTVIKSQTTTPLTNITLIMESASTFYLVNADGKTPTNSVLTYAFKDANSQTATTTSQIVDFYTFDSTSFYLTPKMLGSTTLTITYNTIFTLDITITVTE